jgi:hypothetical protein
LKDVDPTIVVVGHGRGKGKSAWVPDVEATGLEEELVPRPTRGMFQVQWLQLCTTATGSAEAAGWTNHTILTVGPEPRPFENLRAWNVTEGTQTILSIRSKHS